MNFVFWATEFLTSVLVDLLGEPCFGLITYLSPTISSFFINHSDALTEKLFENFVWTFKLSLETIFESLVELLFDIKLPALTLTLNTLGSIIVDAMVWLIKLWFWGLSLVLQFLEMSLIWLIRESFNLAFWITWKFGQLLYGIVINIIQMTWNYIIKRTLPAHISIRLYTTLDPVTSHSGLPVTLIQFVILTWAIIIMARVIKRSVVKRRAARVIKCITCKKNTGELMKIFSRRRNTIRQCIECYTKVSDHLAKTKRRECIICFENASVDTWTSCCGQPLDKKCNKTLVKSCPNCRYKEYQLIKRPIWLGRAFEISEE